MKPDFTNEIEQINSIHLELRNSIEALVKKASGGRSVIYKTNLCDGDPVRISDDVEPLFDGARLFHHRTSLSRYCASVLQERGQIDCIAEIGVAHGIYSAFMADLFEPEKMVLVDKTPSHFRDVNKRPCQEWLEGYSGEVIPQIEDESLDYAYIDGAHDFVTVSDDIEKTLPKMKDGGIIQFNDYTTFNLRFALPYGVKAAVDRLINSKRVAVVGLGLCPLGFDDIALRVVR